MIKGQDAHIPQEAIIGISYAVASAAVDPGDEQGDAARPST